MTGQDENALIAQRRAKLQALSEAWCATPTSLLSLEELEAAASLTRSFPFAVDLWAVQNGYFDVLQVLHRETAGKAQRGDESAQLWMTHFRGLGELLGVRVDGRTK